MEVWPESHKWEKSNIMFKSNLLFHVHQSYEKRRDTQTLYCKKCGGNHFYVGAGDYFTAIKCIQCGWEECIHEG